MARLHNAAQELFAQNVARGRAQVEAYRIAGYTDDNSGASILAARPEINARIKEILEVISARAEASAERVLAELARIGFADITQAVEIKRGHVKIKDTATLSPDVKAAISEIRQGREGVQVKFHDKVRALEQLGKHLGLYKENIELNVNISLLDLVNGSYRIERGEIIEGVANQEVSAADATQSLPDASHTLPNPGAGDDEPS